ncbi:MAG: hypothetical protein ACPHAL_07670 [Parvibaculales bacterium]|jgi:hypothetical protein
MSSLAFDTHKFVTDLTKAGMDTGMAEVLTNHYASLMDDRIATKDDIEFLRKDIESMKERLNTRIIGAQLASIVAICAMLGSLMVILQG